MLGILADCHKDEKVADTQPARDCVQAQWDQQRETFAILYAQEGKFAEAIECVRLMAGFGSDGQLDAFKIITAKMKEAGKSNAEILEVFRTNMREAATLDWPGEKDRAVRRLLEEAKSLGIDQEPAAYREMLEEAFKVARTMAEGQGRPELKWSLMATLALSLHAAGASPERVVQAFAEAVASTGLLEIGSIRNDSIRAIIWDMISAGLILEATQIISTLEDQGAQAMVLWDLTLQIGNKAKNLGEIDLAFQKCLEIARTLSDLPRRIYTLELIASEMNRSSRNKTAVGEIFREAWETARLIEEAYQKADILTKLATEMANASVSRGEVQKVLGEALRAALRAGSETSLIEVAVQMKYAGMERSDVARVFSQALQLATAEAEYNTDKVASEMIKLGLYNEAIEIAQGIPPQRLGNYFADCVEAIRELGLQKVMSDYEVIIPALRKIMNRRVYDINGWNNYWREDYTRPVFEAAELIGKIALEARRTNHPEVLRRIIEDALPHIMGLLTFENPRPGIDYGYVYVLYPLRSTVLQALIDIGEASAITAIERCGNIAWYSPYQNDSYYSVADEKRTAVDYLRRQAQSVEFIPVPGTDMRYWDDHSIFIPQ
ncbi:hypothetical protein HZC35_06625 [Candidatus Saganbacteria bacterium]|nr:hypothetical protein [Candidatus Saganbacteria bacterium]